MVRLLLFRGIALLCACVVALLVTRYPLGIIPPAGLLIVYAGVLWWRPHSWLSLLPAFLPVLNLYPWTGWLFIEEFDLAVLTTLAIGYFRATTHPPRARLTPFASFAVAILLASYLISAALPLRDVQQWAWSALGTYNTPLNSLRVLKGFVTVVLLLPLLLRAADVLGPGFRDTLARGILGGLAVTSIVVLWERLAFPGIMNFSSDYRATGPFFEAHVGGAALDGFLALSLPFAIVLLLGTKSLARIALAAGIVLIGTYATFATFSRGLYGGIALSMAIIGGAVALQRPKMDWGFRTVASVVALFIVALLLFQVFATGGYRTLAAALGALGAALYFGGGTLAFRWQRSVPVILGLSLLTVALVQFVPKGAYVAYGASALMVVVIASLEQLKRVQRPALVLAACAWIGVNSMAVGLHWGGPLALQDAALAGAVAAALALYNRTASVPLWSLTRPTLTAAITAALMLAIAIPVVGNYYMKDRAKTVSRDLQMREEHWQGTIDMRGDGWEKTAFGAGLGSYAERYFWSNRKGEFPGALLYRDESGQQFVRLGGPRTAIGYGETLRLSQHIDPQFAEKLTLTMDVRSTTPKSVVAVSVCEKWLLYPERCRSPKRAPQASVEWTRYVAEIDASALGVDHWWGARPVQLTMAFGRQGAYIDVDNVRLTDGAGRNLLANSAFQNGMDHWFFTSDRTHLPWHAKNLWLGIWFDQGWLGIASVLGFLLSALLGALKLARTQDRFGLALTAALAAFFVVGLFDTLLDAVRLAALFYLLCMAATIRGLQPRPKELVRVC